MTKKAGEGEAAGSGEDTATVAPKKDTAAPADTAKNDVEAKRAAEIEAENQRLRKQLDDRKRKEEEDAAAAAARKAKEEGKLEESLTDAQKRLRETNEENQRLRKQIEDSVMRTVEKLPEAQKSFVMKYKDKADFATWQQLVDDVRSAMPGAAGGSDERQSRTIPPPTGGPVREPKTGDEYEPTEKALQILEDEMVDPKYYKTLVKVEDEEKKQWKFTRPTRDFFRDMNTAAPVKMTYDAATSRRPERKSIRDSGREE